MHWLIVVTYWVALVMAFFSLVLICYFIYRTGVSFKSIEVVLPPLGVVIFAGVLVLRSIISENLPKSSTRIEVNQIIVNENRFASFPTLLNNFSPNADSHLYYIDFGRNIHLTHFFREQLGKTKLEASDYLDAIEFFFIEKLFNGWFVQFIDKSVPTKKLYFKDYKKYFESNLIIKDALENSQSSFKHFFEGDMDFLKTPAAMNMSYVRLDEPLSGSRKFIFEDEMVKLEIAFLDFGQSNFAYTWNPFHAFIAGRIWENPITDKAILKRYNVFFSYEFKSFSSFNNNFGIYKKFINEISDNLNKHMNWDEYSKKLEKEYFIFGGHTP